MKAFREALAALVENPGDRIGAVQMVFSDPTTEPLTSLDRKGAFGAFDRWSQGKRS